MPLMGGLKLKSAIVPIRSHTRSDAVNLSAATLANPRPAVEAAVHSYLTQCLPYNASRLRVSAGLSRSSRQKRRGAGCSCCPGPRLPPPGC
jgi:hypothetical protein